MVLTKNEKKLLLRVLRKEKRRLIGPKEKKQSVDQLIDKLEQSTRNEKVNKVEPSKL